MTRFMLRRLLNYLVLVFLATSIAYFLAAATMNPEANYLGRRPQPSLASVDLTLSHYNLNPHTPIIIRYGRWADGVLHGDLGQTWDGASINAEVAQRSVISLRLLLAGSIIGTAAGVALGAWNAVRQYRVSDQISTLGSFLVNSMTVIVIAVILEQLAIWLNRAAGTNLIKYTGDSTPGLHLDLWHGFLDDVSHQAVPTVALILITMAVIGRYQRSVMLDVLGSDFVRTARAKGLRRRTALVKHALRCALIPSANQNDYFQNYVEEGNFQIGLWEWDDTPDPISGSQEVYQEPQGKNLFQNFGSVGSAQIDALFNQALGDTNTAQARQIADRADAQIWAIGHDLPLFTEPDLEMQKANLANYGAFGLSLPDYTQMGYTS